jgi:peptide/nickel transport system substrate-binding protein
MSVENQPARFPLRMDRRTLVQASAALGLAATASGGALALAGAAARAQEATPGGEYRTATTTEGVSMHPFKVTDTPSFAYIDLLFNLPLMRYGRESLELEPFAAESVEESDDHTKLTFVLKSGLTWSDETPLTANDYAWTWAQASVEENGWPRLGSYSPYIDAVTAVDDTTLEVTLKSPLAISMEKAVNALAYVLPKHIWEALDWSDTEKNPEIMKPSISAGPFILEEWKKDQYATFVANEHFFLGRPNVDKVTFQIFGNANVATQALLEGQIDNYGPEPENWPDILDSDLQAFQWDSPELAVTYFGFNTRLDVFKDKAVRQALNFALDKELITQELTFGLGQRATGMYLPSSWVHNPDVETYAYDLDKAKSLLDEAGWTEGSDGVREKDGQKLEFTFIYGPNTTPIREQMATVAQQMWSEAGAKVEVQGMEWGAYLQMTKEGPYDWGTFVNAYIAAVDPDMIWFKKEADPSYNRVDFHNARVEELYAQGLEEFDREKRKQIYVEIQQILTDEAPWIWLYYEQDKSAFSPRVKGVEITKMGLNDIWEWWIEG